MYICNTTCELALQAAAARASVFGYVFDWRTPVLGGSLGSPHGVEVPFLFGTADVAALYVGTGRTISRSPR